MTDTGSRTSLKRTRERRAAGMVCGVDEAGRGPLAGPVVAAAVILPARLGRALSSAIDDSKKLAPPIREALSIEIAAIAHVGIGIASVAEIDAINILRASLLAMRRAVAALPHTPVLALVDGNQKPPLDIPVELVIGGDGIELSIAAASIVAKVHRDGIMRALHTHHPHYGWDGNAGYATPAHRAALRLHGVTPHHRQSFAPVRQAELDFDAA
jgi:ribonuclease HII